MWRWAQRGDDLSPSKTKVTRREHLAIFYLVGFHDIFDLVYVLPEADSDARIQARVGSGKVVVAGRGVGGQEAHIGSVSMYCE